MNFNALRRSGFAVAFLALSAPAFACVAPSAAPAGLRLVDASTTVAKAMPAVVIVEPIQADGTPAGGHGSGFLFDGAGHILTNGHVVGKAGRARIRFKDGGVRDGVVIGRDPRIDLAVIRIDPPAGVAPLLFADASPAPGAAVIALGSPMSFPFSATSGIVSGDGRAYDVAWPVDFLQHDATINPGSSGGPLVDAEGRVVGVNTATPPEAIFDIGIGLAIPASVARATAYALIAEGHVARGALGIMASSADAAIARSLGVAKGSGLLVDSVKVGGSADRAGIEPGDIITAIDGQRLVYARDLSRALIGSHPGQRVRLSVARRAGAMTIAALLEADDPAAGGRDTAGKASKNDEAPSPDLGLGFGIAADGRVAVVAVAERSIAERYGLRPGDVLLSVGNRPVATAEAARTAIAGQTGELAVLRVERPGLGIRHMALPRTAASAKLRTAGATSESSVGPL